MQNVDCAFDCTDCSIKQKCYKYWKKRAYELASLYKTSTEKRLALERKLKENQNNLDQIGLCIDAFSGDR